MIVLDIDGTISPTKPHEDGLYDLLLPVEERQAFGFSIVIPSYILELLRNPPMELALLSTWGSGASSLCDAFKFEARVLDMEGFTKNLGIMGKRDTVLALKDEVRAWADDHITVSIKDEMRRDGIHIAVPPRDACLTRGQVRDLMGLG